MSLGRPMDRKSNRTEGPRGTVGSYRAARKVGHSAEEEGGRGGSGGVWGRDGGLGPWDGGKGGVLRRESVVEGGGLIEQEVTLWRAPNG